MGLVRRVLRFLRRELRRLNGGVVEELRDGSRVRIGLTGVKVLDDEDDEEGKGCDEEGGTRLVSGGREARTRPRNREDDDEELTGKDSVKHGDDGRAMREAGYRNMSESEIMSKAIGNRAVFSDVMGDPGLVGADSQVEAVAELAVSDPAWASFVDFEADLGVDPASVDSVSGDADAKAGESRHGCTGEGSPDYSPGGGHGVSESGVNPGEGAGPDAGVETGVSISTGADGGVSGGNAVGGGDGGSGSGGSSGGVSGGNSV